MKSRYLLAALLVIAVFAVEALAQQRVKLPITNKEWEAPFPGFKIVGNMYYVGTYDLGCYLIDTGAGLILINSGAPGSYPLIKANIEALGFKTSDIKVITATHGHWDHVGDLALFQKDAPAAKTYINERDARVLEPGGNSFSFSVQDGGRKYNVLVVNMNGINAGVKLLGSPGYPTIVEDFKNTLAMQATYKPDIWVSSHAGQFNLHKVYKPGDPYNPSRFGDIAAYKTKIADLQAAYQKQLAEERAAAK